MRPFKPQNMSNNAAVTSWRRRDWARASAAGARVRHGTAHGHEPDQLKRKRIGAKVVVRGKVRRNATAREYYTLKDELLPVAIEVRNAEGRL